MKKLIFVCVFHQHQFIDLLNLQLESIYLYGKLDDDTKILIYTSSEFMNIIKSSHIYSEKLLFEINDNINTVDLACKSRLNLFNLDTVNSFDRILYLDTDILATKELNSIFEIVDSDILYALEEGNLNWNQPYWGNSYFSQEELDSLQDKSAFSSGILLFNNCGIIKDLFEKIKNHADEDNNQGFTDQAYIVYNAISNKLYDNKKLSLYSELSYNGETAYKNLVHFCGGPGTYIHKLEKMQNIFNIMKNDNQ